MFAHSLNCFKYCYLSGNDSQPLSSTLLRSNRFGYLFATRAIWWTWHDQLTDWIWPLRLSIKPSNDPSWVLRVTWPLRCEYVSCKLADRSRGRPENSLFITYYTEELEKALILTLDCYTYPWSVPYNAVW